MFPKSTYNVAENSRHSTYFSLLPHKEEMYRPTNEHKLRGIPSRTCGTCLWRDPGNLCLIVYRTVRANKPACEHLPSEAGLPGRVHRVRYVEDLPVSVLEEMQVEWGRC